MTEEQFIDTWEKHVRRQEQPTKRGGEGAPPPLSLKLKADTDPAKLPLLLRVLLGKKPAAKLLVESVVYRTPETHKRHEIVKFGSGFIVIEPVGNRRVYVRYEHVEKAGQ